MEEETSHISFHALILLGHPVGPQLSRKQLTKFFQVTAFQWQRCVRSRFGSEAIPIPYAPEACVDDVVED